jgi:hypothetical protein
VNKTATEQKHIRVLWLFSCYSHSTLSPSHPLARWPLMGSHRRCSVPAETANTPSACIQHELHVVAFVARREGIGLVVDSQTAVGTHSAGKYPLMHVLAACRREAGQGVMVYPNCASRIQHRRDLCFTVTQLLSHSRCTVRASCPPVQRGTSLFFYGDTEAAGFCATHRQTHLKMVFASSRRRRCVRSRMAQSANMARQYSSLKKCMVCPFASR